MKLLVKETGMESRHFRSMNGRKLIRVQKAPVSIDVKEIMSRFNDDIKTLKRHIHLKRIQNAAFNSLRANLKSNEVLIQVDYSKNYGNKDQRQIQSAYFGQQSFSIFTSCCYLNIDGVLVNENVTVTSEASDHSRIAALSCWLKVLAFLQEKSLSFESRWFFTYGVMDVLANLGLDLFSVS